MALLSNQSSTNGLEVPTLNELSSLTAQTLNSSSEVPLPPAALVSALPSAPPVSLASVSPYGRPNNKLPRGRHLKGPQVLYDVDVRLPGDVPPQLEVTPITMYSSLQEFKNGRQIAVNRSYICYGLRPNRHIRILNINTAARSLLRGHSEKVTDMAFFAEDVHLLASASSDGRVFVRKFVEGPDDEDILQITDQVLLAIQFIGDWDSVHPCICWLCQTQDVLVVGISRFVFIVDILKVRKAAGPSGFITEEPVHCPVNDPIEGVHCINKHGGDITDLSTSQWALSASASKDGMIRVWKDQSETSLSALTPHDGQQVGAISFLSAPHRPDHIVLLSGGPLNQELKLWVPANGEGWFPSSGRIEWRCTQTLKLVSSAGGRAEDVFFNHVLAVPRAHVILLANSKTSALYVIHVDFGLDPASTRLNYLTEFSVVWPILSFTATSENVRDGEGIVQVYCVQTQAIQQYSLDLAQCVPPVGQPAMLATEKEMINDTCVANGPNTNIASYVGSPNAFELSSIARAKSPNPAASHVLASEAFGAQKATAFGKSDNLTRSTIQSVPLSGESTPFGDSRVIGVSKPEAKEVSMRDVTVHVSKIVAPTSQFEGTSQSPIGSPLAKSRTKNPTEDEPTFHVVSPRDQSEFFCSFEQPENFGETEFELSIPSSPDKALRDSLSVSPRRHFTDTSKTSEDSEWKPPAANLPSAILDPQNNAGPSMHLITPSELMSMVARSKMEVDGASTTLSSKGAGILKELIKPVSSSERFMTKGDSEAVRIETKEMTEDASFEIDSKKVVILKRGSPSSDARMDRIPTPLEFSQVDSSTEAVIRESSHIDQDFDQAVVDQREDDHETVEEKEPSQVLQGDEACEPVQDIATKMENSWGFSVVSQTRRKKNKNKTDANVLMSSVGPSSSASMPSVLASGASTSEQDLSKGSSNVTPSKLAAQINAMQDTLNQLVAMQKDFQKQLQVNLAVPVAKEVKRVEAVLGQRMEKVLKAHMDAMWARLQEDSAKREKMERDQMQQLSSYLSNCLNKEIPAALERVLRKEFSLLGPSVARLVTPSVEKSITTAVNEAFQKGISERGMAQLEKSVGAKMEASLSRQLQAQFQTSGKNALQEALRSCLEGSVIPAFERSCQAMFGQVDAAFQKGLMDNQTHAQQQLATSTIVSALQDAVASATALATSLQGEMAEGQRRLVALVENAAVSRGYIMNAGLADKAMTVQHVEESLDPTKELARLISERKVEEAFNKALSLADVGVVSWLCNQVDLAGLLTVTPLPLSQGVLLALVQQLGCDLGNDTGKKLMWIKDAALALNPLDPGLPPHVMRHFLEKLYNNLHALLATTLSNDLIPSTRLVIHVVNSLLTACK